MFSLVFPSWDNEVAESIAIDISDRFYLLHISWNSNHSEVSIQRISPRRCNVYGNTRSGRTVPGEVSYAVAIDIAELDEFLLEGFLPTRDSN